jgi:hypothetical protein
MELVVIGGGCYGTYHARQLLKACHAGKLAAERIVVVDHNGDCRARRELGDDPLLEVASAEWQDFLDGYLVAQHEDSYVVPAPFSPHLFYHWLVRACSAAYGRDAVAMEPASQSLGVPVEIPLANGQRAISYAPWICPATCVEPAVCPATKGPRDWSLAGAVRRFAADPASGVSESVVFPCYHLAHGIGAVPVRTLLQAREQLLTPTGQRPRRVAVATVSHCHGILGVLSLTGGKGTAHGPA